ncbi:MAG TPA: LON peptidase substrate-binding domain-containing protein [Alphaproteobacteria bacterium]|nr:LON peptidase substrate-binding domain-containing protein [Alphaproteobacteria bacterium]
MKFQDLPSILPLYAANGIILLPHAQLPLILQGRSEKAIFEYALQDEHRLVGVIQANPEGGHFQKGCVGRIINFQDGAQVFVILGGLCRFKIEEILEEEPFKKARVSYLGYESDLDDSIADPFVDRPRLLNLLKDYLEDQDITANWDEIDHASNDLIISSLSMACPFKPIEKQALLEISSLSDRCDMMIALMEMASPHLKGRRPMIH